MSLPFLWKCKNSTRLLWSRKTTCRRFSKEIPNSSKEDVLLYPWLDNFDIHEACTLLDKCKNRLSLVKAVWLPYEIYPLNWCKKYVASLNVASSFKYFGFKSWFALKIADPVDEVRRRSMCLLSWETLRMRLSLEPEGWFYMLPFLCLCVLALRRLSSLHTFFIPKSENLIFYGYSPFHHQFQGWVPPVPLTVSLNRPWDCPSPWMPLEL